MADIKKRETAMLNMTEGRPVSLIIQFSIPMLIGNLFQQLYNLVDSVIVGQFVGADALAAIGATGSVTFLFFALCNGIGSGGGIITSQFFGKGNVSEIKSCIVNTGYIMMVFPVIVGFIAFLLSAPVLGMLSTPSEIMADAVAYMRIMCVGIVFVSLYNYASSMLRALGDSKTPLYFLIFSCILNTVLDIIFVCVLHMSVAGAGIATVIAQLVSGISCLFYAIKKNEYFHMQKEDLKFDTNISVKILKLGVPLSLQFSLIAISCMALQRVVNSFGKVAVAAFTATSRIEQIIHQPYQTLGAALSTFTGQNYGARKNDRIITGYRKSLLLMAIFSALMLPIMQLFGEGIIRIFVEDEDVIQMGAMALRITSFFYVMLGVIYVVRGVLNGLGDSFFALLNGIVEVIGRFIVPILLTKIPAIGLWGIWWSVGIVWAISGVTAWMRYVSFKKKTLL
ncbi:MATE family efflux transporter [Butyrivibrio sp. YAB3001]|uniref:MATE family efflux transporter n=1 Tax=Butyrivibrio sp. YAB3001 TaxID=1520812 RepID=UPI0008F62272|nr:MATE family efflux transporter [Butyrivibrio sp. YAB3001]SFB72916.1 putative efflux protein, MATE family [Butyrivibrio sp. YAB3001]